MGSERTCCSLRASLDSEVPQLLCVLAHAGEVQVEALPRSRTPCDSACRSTSVAPPSSRRPCCPAGRAPCAHCHTVRDRLPGGRSSTRCRPSRLTRCLGSELLSGSPAQVNSRGGAPPSSKSRIASSAISAATVAIFTELFPLAFVSGSAVAVGPRLPSLPVQRVLPDQYFGRSVSLRCDLPIRWWVLQDPFERHVALDLCHGQVSCALFLTKRHSPPVGIYRPCDPAAHF